MRRLEGWATCLVVTHPSRRGLRPLLRVRCDFVEALEEARVSARAHSPPMGAPFSATERFISGTTSTSTNVTRAKIQKQSK